MTSPTPNLPNESHLLEDYNFVVLGLPGVGKSTFVTQVKEALITYLVRMGSVCVVYVLEMEMI
jgi:nucleoside-triphosphatase THEP1